MTYSCNGSITFELIVMIFAFWNEDSMAGSIYDIYYKQGNKGKYLVCINAKL